MHSSLFLKNLWYFALHGDKLKPGKLQQRQILGEKIVFGRDENGKPFALQDNCPHRGVPLSNGKFDGKTIECCYHGWQFNCSGTCQKIPALADSALDVSKIKAASYPCKELNNTVWVYIPENRSQIGDAEKRLPDLMIPPDKKFLEVQSVVIPTNIDHATVGLIDPAHVTFVHQSWFWRSAKATRLKEKLFEPTGTGFRMVRHKPSSNSRGYSILKGGASTEISFQLPGHRFEHIQIGENHTLVSITVLTPIDENSTELNHIVYSSLSIIKYLWWPLKNLATTFICQDVHVFEKLRKGLESDPKLMLIGDPDTQARWYFELKKHWNAAQANNSEFINPLQPQRLKWIT
jgi:phenylpropionate dioxygenase-like ring-hydroxylating dioxygenase large terminal subunit